MDLRTFHLLYIGLYTRRKNIKWKKKHRDGDCQREWGTETHIHSQSSFELIYASQWPSNQPIALFFLCLSWDHLFLLCRWICGYYPLVKFLNVCLIDFMRLGWRICFARFVWSIDFNIKWGITDWYDRRSSDKWFK